MHYLRRHSWTVLALGLFLTGCGSGADGDAGRQKVFQVKGKITMGGNPVTDAIVSFSPKGQQPAATGRTAADGRFTLKTYEDGDGAAAGEYIVMVTKLPAATSASPIIGHDPKNPKPVDTSAMHAASVAAASAPGLPAKYAIATQSDLAATVKADNSNDFTFDLKP